jgi:hypothetical protein
MNPGPDVCRGKTGDFGNRFHVRPFEVRQHQLSIDWLQPVNQCQQARQRLVAVGKQFDFFLISWGFGFLQSQKGSRVLSALLDHV